MKKTAVISIFLFLAVGMMVLAGMEYLARSVGGVPLMIACYGIIAGILMIMLMKTNRQIQEEKEKVPEETNETQMDESRQNEQGQDQEGK